MTRNSTILPLIGILGVFIHFCIKTDYTSVIPYTFVLSIPLLINVALSMAISRPSAHSRNNFSAGLYILVLSVILFSGKWELPLMILAGTALGPLLLIIFPIQWIATWLTRHPEPNP